MTNTMLVTGGAGFIGSQFVRYVLRERSQYEIINLDLLTYSGNLDNLIDVQRDPRHELVVGSVTDRQLVQSLVERCDFVVHFAAESHVDRSIVDSSPFINTNVVGTQTILDAVRQAGGRRMVHVSTDEVYGSLPLDRPDLKFTEESPIAPNSPYAASKAASDLLVRAYHHTFGLDAIITRCSNNFGPYQFPEKVIPLFVTRLLKGDRVPVYGTGQNVRDWLHVDDHCDAILRVMEQGRGGEVYNVGGDNERTNLELTDSLLDILGLGRDRIEFVADRLGHDLRYAIDSSKIQRELGWQPQRSAWPNALESTVCWYAENEHWWRRIESGEYRQQNLLESIRADQPGITPAKVPREYAVF